MDTRYRYNIPHEKRSWRDTINQNENVYRKSSTFDANPIFSPPASPMDAKPNVKEEPSKAKSFLHMDAASRGQQQGVGYLMQEQPLISPEVLDVPAQRAVAFSIFLIIQSYKIYDLVLLKSGLPVAGVLLANSKFNFISKYAIIDSLFLYFLPSFKIPRLRYKPVIVFFQICLMVGITVFLSNEKDFALVSLLISVWTKYNKKELSLTGASVNHRKVMDSSAHFKGAYTVKIQPENTVMLNPFQQSFCIPIGNNLDQLKVPMRVNSTSEISFLQLEHHDLYSDEISLLNYTKKELTKLKTANEPDPNILYLQVPLTKVGYYELKKIVDVNNFDLRIYRPQLMISSCPSAVISGMGTRDKCIGDLDKVTFQVTGVPPMKLKYFKTVNGERLSYVYSSLRPEYFESPLLANRTFTKEDIADLKWARDYSVDVDLESFVNIEGGYSYEIEEIVDGLGNVVGFQSVSPQLRDKYQLNHEFKVHDLPRASLDEVANPNSVIKKSLVLNVESMTFAQGAPYVAIISHESGNESSVIKHEFSRSGEELPIEKPGTYILKSIESKYCKGSIVGKSTVLITKPIPPQLTVKSTPIFDQCIGQVGLNFDLTFTGVPPFHYTTKIFKLENGKRVLHDKKQFSSKGTRSQYSYNPTMEGHYEIVFDDISNALFKAPMHLEPTSDYTFETSMRVKAEAKITSKFDTRLCLGDSSSIPIKFTGEPPFSIDYDIVETSSNKRTSFHLDNISNYNHNIVTPKFNVGGDYILSLISVKDSSGCLVSLSGGDARIKVRRDVPMAAFNTIDTKAREIKIKDGAIAQLPIRLSGEPPFTVRYEHIDTNGVVTGISEAKFPLNYRPVLNVSKEGTYRLVSVQDQSCMGKLDPNDVRNVTFFEKPRFKVLGRNRINRINDYNYEKEPVCQGFKETVDISLFGSAPFTVLYELISPNGQISSESMQVATKYATLKLPNEQAGEYTLKIKGVYDSYYTQQNLPAHVTKASAVSIKQVVNPSPLIKFAERGKTYRTCSANIDQPSLLDPIPLHISDGNGPYSISFSIYHENTSKTDYVTITDVTEDSFDYKQLYQGLKLGSHIISIEKFVDANGCGRDTFPENNHVLISITDVPKINLLEPNMAYCVGDYVSYQLNGVAPFIIKYEFNGIQLKSKEQTSQFVRFASEPGTISVNSIEDSSSQCVVNFKKPGMKSEFERLSLVIHPIPSVALSAGGDNPVEDIHEGDQAEVVFHFEGTPPFSLTYVRTEEVNGKKSKRPQIVETHKVTDIYSYEYRILTSLQGTYEAIEVSDLYCSAKNDAFFNNY